MYVSASTKRNNPKTIRNSASTWGGAVRHHQESQRAASDLLMNSNERTPEELLIRLVFVACGRRLPLIPPEADSRIRMPAIPFELQQFFCRALCHLMLGSRTASAINHEKLAHVRFAADDREIGIQIDLFPLPFPFLPFGNKPGIEPFVALIRCHHRVTEEHDAV